MESLFNNEVVGLKVAKILRAAFLCEEAPPAALEGFVQKNLQEILVKVLT